MATALINLHNHTAFSDGAYTIDELVEAHLDCKDASFAGVGISDHLFCTPQSHEVGSEREFERIFANETRKYVREVSDARRRWEGKIQIFVGAEISWPLNKQMLNVIRGMLDGVDYVLFEHLDWAGLTTLANQSRKFPCPIGLAHTDVGEQFPNTSMDQVVRTIANARIFYELNSKFLPIDKRNRWLALLPKHRVGITLGSDTHDDLNVISTVAELHSGAQHFGLDQKYFVPAPSAREVAQTA